MSTAAPLLTVLLLICSTTLAFGHASLRQAGEAEAKSSTSSIGSKLPVFFFHGLSSNASSGARSPTNLTADGRAFTALTLCQGQCSGKALYLQVQDAIAQIQGIVSGTSAIYKDGYIFMGLSQGALTARAVVEEWDNHNVKTLISLAGPQNGLFYGPQQPDYLALAVLSVYDPKAVDKSVFDFSKFSPAGYNGKMQRTAAEAVLYPYFSKLRVAANLYLAALNNANVWDCKNAVCLKAQKRRRANFLKLHTAHFFGSLQDDFVSSWQSSILGQYPEVRTTEQIEMLFAQFCVLGVKQTSEYKQESYGLQALGKRGGLFLHAVPYVGHSCWVHDYVTADGGLDCKFQPVYDAHIYPVLRDPLRKSTTILFAPEWFVHLDLSSRMLLPAFQQRKGTSLRLALPPVSISFSNLPRSDQSSKQARAMTKYALFLTVTALLGVFSTALAQSDLIPSGTLALPIFFFHGVTANATAGHNLEANLTAEGRLFTALSFCPDLCSVEALNLQIPLVIAQIRSIVANDPRYDNGYVFVSHSQGGAIARGVIEEMDDHKVKVFVSMAGAVNGGFNGPQPTDTIPFLVFVNYLGPRLLPAAIFDFSKYTQADYSGKLQRDFAELAANTPSLQDQYSAFNLGRSPYYDQWVKTNPYFPVINNLKVCDAGDVKCDDDKKRRRDNFLKLKEAHFFASSGDDVISPWQQSHLGSYSEVASAEEIETKFASLKVLDATQTREYLSDSYGLQTLDKRGGLFFHTIANIGHNCWLDDYTAVGQTVECKFKPLFNDHLYPAFQGPAFFYTRPQC